MPSPTRRDFLIRTTATAGGGILTTQSSNVVAANEDEIVWRTYGFDARNSAEVPVEGPTAEPSAHWEAEIDGQVEASPAVADGSLYIGGSEGLIFSINPIDGEVSWQFDTADSVRSPPTIQDDVVFAGDDSGVLYAIDGDSGDSIWTAETGADVTGAPAVVDETVYVGSFDGTLYAFDVTNGSNRWEFETDGVISGGPAVIDDAIFFGSGDEKIYSVDTHDGSERWEFEADAEVTSSPAADGERVYVTTAAGTLYTLDSATGEAHWSFELTGLTGSSPALSNEVVYAADGIGGESLHALSAADGDLMWSVELDGTPTSPVVAEETVYIGTDAGSLYALGADGGDELWRIDIEQGLLASPVILENSAFIGTQNGLVYGLSDDQIPEYLADTGQSVLLPLLITLGALGVGAGAWWIKKWGVDPEGGSPIASDKSEGGTTSSRGSEINPSTQQKDNHNQEIDKRDTRSAADGIELSTYETEFEWRLPDTIPDTVSMSLSYDSLDSRERVGSGGNADVYRTPVSRDEGEAVVAIKEPRLSGTLHTETVDTIVEEAQTWASIDNHDHIVGVVDYATQPLPWIAMEYMDAGTLSERAGQLSLPESLWVALGIAKGVRHAHRNGIAHLDLKPENVLFRSVENAWDVPKIADWGLSKSLLENPNTVQGLTLQYAAPEQFDEDYGPTDNITDLYQLGAVLYTLFTGMPPYEGKPAEVMNAVLKKDPTPPSEATTANDNIPDEIDNIVLQAMAKEREDRYDDIIYLRDDLESLAQQLGYGSSATDE